MLRGIAMVLLCGLELIVTKSGKVLKIMPACGLVPESSAQVGLTVWKSIALHYRRIRCDLVNCKRWS